jgi:long-subunit fatty acid transport protein
MKIFYKIVLISAIVIFSINNINAQYVENISKRGTSVTPFLKVAQGARATGMGGAFVGVADDASSIFWNVAGIARLEKNTVMFDHTQWIADLKYNYLAGSLDLGNYGAIGVSLIASNYGEMDVTTIAEPEGTGQVFSVKDYAFSLAWAINLTEDFAIGFNPKVIYESIWQTSGYAFAIDMGVLYNTPFEGFTLGMSITNLGSKMRLQGTSDIVLYDPDPTTTGNNGRIPADLYTDSWSLPLVYTMGISYKVVDNDMHKFVIDLDAHHPSDNYESVSLGGEYVFHDYLAIRGGYKTLFLKDAEETFALGAGIKQQILGNIAFRVDYAYQNFGRLASVHKLSIGVDF